jgi:hypothetical protein
VSWKEASLYELSEKGNFSTHDKDIVLEVNAEKNKYVIMSRDQNAGQNGNIQIGNISFETMEALKYLGITLTNQNSIHE